MNASQEAYERWLQELYNTDHWDIAGIGYQTIDEFLKDFAQQQKQVLLEKSYSGAEIERYRKNYETYYNAVKKINAKMRSELAGGIPSEADKAITGYMQEQERMLKASVDALRSRNSFTIGEFHLLARRARFAELAGKSLGGFVGIGEILDAADKSGRTDEVGKVSAGVLAGLSAGAGAGAFVTWAATFFGVAGGPPTWLAAAGIGIYFGQVADKWAQAAWHTWISGDADRRVREIIERAKEIYGEDSETAETVESQLKGNAEKLGALNGTWLEGYDNLSSEDKAFLSFLFFVPSGSIQRFTDGRGDDLSEFNSYIGDLRTIFDAPWRRGQLAMRDALLVLMNTIAADASKSYAEPRITQVEETLLFDVPSSPMVKNYAIRSVAEAILAPSDAPYVGLPLDVQAAQITLSSAWLSGTTFDDLLIGSEFSDTLQGEAGFDYLLGGGGADRLLGGSEADVIFGGSEADTIDGGDGADYLLGGEGTDIYSFNKSHGPDTIIDSDGRGLVLIDDQLITGGIGSSGSHWISENKDFGFTLGDKDSDGNQNLVISQGSPLNTVTIRNWKSGHLGIYLSEETEPAAEPTNIILGGRQYIESTDPVDVTDNLGNLVIFIANQGANDVLNGDHAGRDAIFGGDGNDLLAGHGGKDILQGEDGNDTLLGGAGDDFISGGDGMDIAWGDFRFMTRRFRRPNNPPQVAQIVGEGWWAHLAGNAVRTLWWNVALLGYDSGADVITTGEGDDWVKGDFGNDLVELGAGNDTGNGDDGSDTLFGDDGDDTIWGDYVYGIDFYGQEYLTSFEGQGTDVIHGGAGNDIIYGVGSGDLIYGGDHNDSIYGDDVQGKQPSSYHGDDFLDGGTGADNLYGSGGSDDLYGGDGNDQLYGDSVYAIGLYSPRIEFHGNDFLAGGAGSDRLIGDGGNDELDGGSEDDYLRGDSSVQSVPGELHGRDSLLGGAGSDQLQGDGNGDILRGGDGSDIMLGDGDPSILHSRFHGNDYLEGGAGEDYLEGGGSRDDLSGNEGDDTLIGDSNSTWLESSAHGDDNLEGGEGNDQLYGNGGNDSLSGGDGNDQLLGDSSTNVFQLQYPHGRDILDGGAGDDFLIGGGSDDDLYGGDGNDIISGDNSANERLDASIHGNDYLDGGDGDDVMAGNGGHDVLLGGNGSDRLFGDEFTEGDGNDLMFGNDGNDILVGGGGNDTLDGGEGNDELHGGEGDDIYLFGYGSGNDLIYETNGPTAGINSISMAGVFADDVSFSRAADGSLRLALISTGETLTILGYFSQDVDHGNLYSIECAAGASFAIADIRTRVFGGTAIGDRLNGTTGDDVLDGDTGNDTINGGIGDDDLRGGEGRDTVSGDDGNDLIRGGTGADELYGGDGNDTYIFSRGDGQDIIHDAGLPTDHDTLILEDIEPSSVAFVQSASNLLVYLDDSVDQVSIVDYFKPANVIERIRFADGQEWDSNQISLSLRRRYIGGHGNDSFRASTSNDFLDGGAGNDYLWAGLGGDDHLIGGAGDDELFGDGGDDTYYFTLGDGRDYLHDTGFVSADRIEFGAGITLDSITVRLTSSGSRQPRYEGSHIVGDSLLRHIEIAYSTGDSIELPLIYTRNGGWVGEYTNTGFLVAFSDGTEISLKDLVAKKRVTPLSVVGMSGNELLYDGLGDDYVNGGSGDDIIVTYFGNNIIDGGAGNDRIYGSIDGNTYLFSLGMGFDHVFEDKSLVNSKRGENKIRVSAGIRPDEVKITRPRGAGEFAETGLSLVLRHQNGMDKLVISGWDPGKFTIDVIEFEDGTTWNTQDIQRQLVLGSDGNDDIDTTSLIDLVRGGSGDDRIYQRGSRGNDNDILLGENGNDVIYVQGGLPHLSGGSGNDRFEYSFRSTGIIDPGPGDDEGSGNNSLTRTTIFFDRGYETDTFYTDGDNIDIVFGPSIRPDEVIVNTRNLSEHRDGNTVSGVSFRILESNDVLIVNGALDESSPGFFMADGMVVFGDGTMWSLADIRNHISVEGSNYNDKIAGKAEDDSIKGWDGNDTLYGNLGNDIIEGGPGDDLVLGNSGDDLIDGGPGNDTIDGGNGNDTYIFGVGAGQDFLTYEYSGLLKEYDMDTIQIQVLPSEVELSFIETSSRQGSLAIRIAGTSDELLVDDWAQWNPSLSGLQLRFADGTIWDTQAVVKNASPLIRLDNISLYGTPLDDTFLSAPGSQYIYGFEGNDQIAGGVGRDVLHGGGGDDFLDGGEGKDELLGSTGDDSYAFGYGYGQDVIFEFLGGDDPSINYGYDKVVFKPGVRPQDVSFGFDLIEQNFVFRLANSSDRLAIENSSKYSQASVECAIFDDGTEWNLLTNPTGVVAGTQSNDLITGTKYNDRIRGGSGSDTIDGDFGDDEIDGGDGADVIHGKLGNNRIDGGDGNDYLTGDGTIVGGAGDDIIYGDLVVEGGIGNDTLYVSNGTKLLFRRGDGADTVHNGGGAFQVVLGIGILPTEIILSSASYYDHYGGLHLEITLQMVDSSDSICIKDVDYNTDYSGDAMATVYFANGTTWSWDEILGKLSNTGTHRDDILATSMRGGELFGKDGNDRLNGGVGHDILRGGNGIDTLTGRDGNDLLDGGSDGIGFAPGIHHGMKDLLYGGKGNDCYFFDRGYGWDVIDEYMMEYPSAGEINTLIFGSSISPDDIVFVRDYVNDENRSSADIHLQIRNTTDRITIRHFFGETFRPNGIHEVVFSDGSAWDRTEVINRYWASAAFAGQVEGSGIFIEVEGTKGDNRLVAFANSDRVYGHGGNDILDGNGGDDTIYGGSGNDILDDAAGNDILDGGIGDDTYYFGPGYGEDLIVDFDRLNGIDSIKIIGGLCPSDVTVERDDVHIFLGIKGSDDRLAIRWYPHASYQLESIEFAACGTVWDSKKLESIASGEPFLAPVAVHQIASAFTYEDQHFSFAIPEDTFQNTEPNDALSFNAALSDGRPLPSWLYFDAKLARFSGTPGNSDVGAVDIRVTATNRSGLSVWEEFNLSVLNVNDSPYVFQTLPDLIISEGKSFSFAVPEHAFRDVDMGDFLSYSATLGDGNLLPSWLDFEPRTQMFHGTPTSFNGRLDVRIVAVDQAGSSVGDDFTFNVFAFKPPIDIGSTVEVDISAGFVALANSRDSAIFKVSGSARVGESLTAILQASDPDGDGPFSFQWQSSSDGTNWLNLGSEEIYTVTSSDQGKQLRLAVTYTDRQNFQEFVTVAAGTVPIAPPPEQDLRMIALDTITLTNSPLGGIEAIATLNEILPARSLTAIGIDNSSITLGSTADFSNTQLDILANITSIGAPAVAVGLDRSRLLMRPGNDSLTIESRISTGGTDTRTSVAVRNSFVSANRGDDLITLRGDLWGERALIFAGDGNDQIIAYGIGRDSFIQAGPGNDLVSLGRLETTPGAAPLDRVNNDPIAPSTYRGGTGFDTLQLREVSQADFNAEAVWFTSPGENGLLFRGARFSGFENITFA